MPDYYPFIRTARYLNVPPWELWEAPEVWIHWARACQNAENGARNAAQEQARGKL
jgi:hypothetical protein